MNGDKRPTYIGQAILVAAGIAVGAFGFFLVTPDYILHRDFPDLYPAFSEFGRLGIVFIIFGLLLIMGAAATLIRKE